MADNPANPTEQTNPQPAGEVTIMVSGSVTGSVKVTKGTKLSDALGKIRNISDPKGYTYREPSNANRQVSLDRKIENDLTITAVVKTSSS